ncbi:hypothetical protein C8R43DRAFT_1125253 [Mycena crocata]|nr:hypothetical protein C8R43DRAFT_1125253 [Mycena crocata]
MGGDYTWRRRFEVAPGAVVFMLAVVLKLAPRFKKYCFAAQTTLNNALNSNDRPRHSRALAIPLLPHGHEPETSPSLISLLRPSLPGATMCSQTKSYGLVVMLNPLPAYLTPILRA